MTDREALLAGLPVGTTDLAARLLATASDRLEALDGRRLPQDEAAVVELLLAPRLLDDGWPDPTPARVVAGGAVHADLVDDDLALFEALAEAWGPEGPEALAVRAQECRLPVTPYRRHPRPVPDNPTGTGTSTDVGFSTGTTGTEADAGIAGTDADAGTAGSPAGPDPGVALAPRAGGLRGLVVVDLSALWAGPLCTALLARHGARVVKVEPACRPDGFRSRPALHHWFNRAKDVVDWDLRRPADRRRFAQLVGRADLVVHSFSRRVLPNLGYGPAQLRALNPTLATVGITAFPAGSPEADWVAYGSGVHAASGLGLLDGEPTPAPVSYPDPLAGLAAFIRALELVGRPGPSDPAEVSLAGVIGPLLPTAVAS